MNLVSVLLLLSSLLVGFLSGKWKFGAVATGFLTLLFLIFSTIYFVANRLTGAGFNESVFYHLRTGIDGAGISDFAPTLLAFLTLVAGSMILAIQLVRFLLRRPVQRQRQVWARALQISLLFFALFAHPLSEDLKTAYSTQSGLMISDYFELPTLSHAPSKPKNIVYIYLESLERTYLDEQIFPGLTPQILELEKEALSFVDIGQAWGTGWTIAGMTASQCGIPLVTTGSGGSTMYGMSEFLPNATCLGDILAERSYKLSYMGGAHLNFAGKGKFYASHGFERVNGREELRERLSKPDYLNGWGLYDDSLFDLAWEEFTLLADGDAPFGLFLLTLDTHHPDGYPSASCQEYAYKDVGNSSLDAVACSDHLAAKFIHKIMNSTHSDDTLIVLASDHLSFPNKASAQLKLGDRKNLFMVFAKDIKPATIEKAGTMLDVAPTLLGLMGYGDLNFGLGRNLLGDEPSLREELVDIDSTLRSFETDLKKFWQFPAMRERIVINPEKLVLQMGDESLALPVLLKIQKTSDPTVLTGLQIEEIYFEGYWYVGLKDNLYTFRDDPLLWVDKCSHTALVIPQTVDVNHENFCVFAGKLGRSEFFHQEIDRATNFSLSALMAYSDKDVSTTLLKQQKRALKSGQNPVQITAAMEYLSNEKAKTEQANTPEAFVNLSNMYYQSAKYQLSIEASESALRLRPDYAIAYNNICAAMNMQDRFGEAISKCEKALSIDPKNKLALGNLNWAKRRLTINK